MAAYFKNPSNGHTEVVGPGSSFGVLFFGILYLAAKGLWVHVALWLLVVGFAALLAGGAGLIIALPLVSICYAATIQGILQGVYAKKGWIESETEAEMAHESFRNCPFCAEQIKSAAVKCKHCGSDVEAVSAPVIEKGWVAVAFCRDQREKSLATQSIAAESYSSIEMNSFNVGAGLFSTKEEAKVASARLRDNQKLFTEVEYQDHPAASTSTA